MHNLKYFISIFFYFLGVAFLYSSPSITTKSVQLHFLNPNNKIEKSFDSIALTAFINTHPKLNLVQKELCQFYEKEKYTFQWYDDKGLNEYAQVLSDKINNISDEGIDAEVPYKEELSIYIQNNESLNEPKVEVELLLSAFYFYYTYKVFKGVSIQQSNELGWYLPRKNKNYLTHLDSLLHNPKYNIVDETALFTPYSRFKKALVKYKEIEQNGGWNCIELPANFKMLKPNDTSTVVLQIRKHLFLYGDLNWDSGSNRYDSDLLKGVLLFKKRHAFEVDSKITPLHIDAMNIPVSDRIETIMANMERCRWTIPNKSKEYIVVNIPSFQLTYVKEGKVELESKVVVGKAMNQTVIFSGLMNQIIFCPYWYVPKSILDNEVRPDMEKNPNYLQKNDMEWFEDKLRQRPGPKNSLGVVKFLFPNNNNIYLHDTPSKSLFKREYRAFSHGCIRLEKPVELAKAILKNDKNWTPEKIDETIACGYEFPYQLKVKIPVSIGYFTSWVDDQDRVYFYKDIYYQDHRLVTLLKS